MTIREIEAKDNAGVESLIRTCLIEYGANHEGTAWADPDLSRFSEIYNSPGNQYWVATDKTDRVVAGVGIGRLPGLDGICELQKMYCLPEARGTGIAYALMGIALEYARRFYRQCYLETLPNMTRAQKFYEKHGFRKLSAPIIQTGHFACDTVYIKDL